MPKPIDLIVATIVLGMIFSVQAGGGERTTPGGPPGGEVSVFMPGIPDFAPLQKKGMLSAHTAVIDIEEGELSLVVGKEPTGVSRWLLRRFVDGSVGLSSAQAGWNRVEVNRESEEHRLLYLDLSEQPTEVCYAWGETFFPSEFKTGSTAPDLEAIWLNGDEFDLSELRGKTVVLNWWATWCLPCIEEIPELNELVSRYEGESVAFVAIARNTPAEVLGFLQSHEFTYQQAVSAPGTEQVLGESFPRHIVVGRDGTVVHNRSGFGGSLELLRTVLDVELTRSGRSPNNSLNRTPPPCCCSGCRLCK
jgi:thiol-disulfide isomerase/thioredoxin